jgi:outer membrane protein TolC
MKKSLSLTPALVSPLHLPLVNLTRGLITAAALAGLSGCLTGCVQEPPPFDPRAAREWEQIPDNEVKQRPKFPLPTTGETPYIPGETPPQPNNHLAALNVPEGPPVRMSLQEIIHRAMANNMEVRVASYDTAVDQTRVLEAEANFDPTIFSDINFQRIDKQTGGSDTAQLLPPTATDPNPHFGNDIVVRYDQEQLFTSDIGIQQNLPAGGKIKLEQDVNNSWFNPPRTILRSYYENDLVLTLTQPLLQNFGVEVNRARITVAINNQRISLLDFRKTVEDTVLKIEQVYWQLVQAERDVETTKRLIKESSDLRAILYKRLGADVNGSQVYQANALISSHEVTLIQLQFHVADLSDELKQLMNDPSFPVTGSPLITPTDEGTETPLHFDLNDQIETGLNNRYELGQQQARIDSAQISALVAKNNLLPSLTSQIQLTVDGLQHDIGPTFGKEGDFNHIGYQAGFQFQYPLGNRAARAIWQRALLQRMQAIASYAGLINQIALDVKTASRNVDATWERLSKARDSRLQYEKLIEQLNSQVSSGDQTLSFDFVFNILQDQAQLAQAEQTEHQALNDYNFAIATLEKNKGTILRYNNVLMEQEQLPFDMAVKGSPVPGEMLLGTLRRPTEAPIMPVIPAPVLPTSQPVK